MEQDDPWMPREPGTAGTAGAATSQAAPGADQTPVASGAPGFRDAVLDAALTGGLFAVLDGAQFDNLPKALMMGGFVSRPLYLDRGDNNREQVITAPHLVLLDERGTGEGGRPPEAVVPALFDLIETRPAAVFWRCEAGGEALYKHLRGINMVLYPRAALAGMDEPPTPAEDGGPVPETHVRVVFRHADANVIAQVLYAMDAVELARFYGPADCLYFAPEPDWTGGRPWLQAPRPEGLPEPARGALTLSMATVERMQGTRQAYHRRRINAYLRKVAPEQTAQMDDAALDKATAGFMAEAQTHGVKSESAMGRWCFLQVLTGGQMGKQPAVTDYVARGDPTKSADDRVRDLMHMAAFRASTGG